jgi:hypothetical protein
MSGGKSSENLPDGSPRAKLPRTFNPLVPSAKGAIPACGGTGVVSPPWEREPRIEPQPTIRGSGTYGARPSRAPRTIQYTANLGRVKNQIRRF